MCVGGDFRHCPAHEVFGERGGRHGSEFAFAGSAARP